MVAERDSEMVGEEERDLVEERDSEMEGESETVGEGE